MMKQSQPHPEKVPYPIVRPRPGLGIRFVSMSRSIFGIDTHYGGGRTYYCPGRIDCESCKKGHLQRYQGYLMGCHSENGTVAVVHLTAGAAEIISKLETGDRGLVGLKCVLLRSGQLDNGAVEVQPYGWTTDVQEFPQEEFEKLIHSIYRIQLIPKPR